ncbi:MAG: VWA domain-containing protein [Fusobacterium sp. JB021]|nr:VWA domain-containing protein [Fusobacterium sp. JB021]MDP0507038.1 VWA domain-containing protein [Fusobacterium sp. JB019]
MFKFQNPYFFILILVIIYLFFKKRKKIGITIPSVKKVKKYSLFNKKYLIGKYLIFISMILMIAALARPQIVSKETKIKKDGVDIVISLDLSLSMLQEDFKPNRLEKSKEMLKKFIQKRPNDRLGLVIFGGDAYTKIPLTFDNQMVKETVDKITIDDITSNKRTAIGMGLGVSLNRLKDSKAKSKVIILMTDGENNAGSISPKEATKLAKKMGIKIYTIGIGAKEIQVSTLLGKRTLRNTQLDENLLKNIAQETNGKYFRASDADEFNKIFNEINKLEKSKIEAREFYSKEEYYIPLLKGALILLALGILFEFLLFIRLP